MENMTKWFEKYDVPTDDQLLQYGVDWDLVIKHAEILGPQVLNELCRVIGGDLCEKKILDFGCGLGRISLKMYDLIKQPTHACDVNQFSTDWLSKQLPEIDIQNTGFKPPLPYDDETFDAIFSISIWRHLHPKMQIPWLVELRRILKPGGYALVSIAGIESFKRRQAKYEEWQKFTEKDVKLQGVLFTEYKLLRKVPDGFPGIEDSYGSTIHDSDFVKECWGCLFDSLEIREGAIAGSQDLVVMKR